MNAITQRITAALEEVGTFCYMELDELGYHVVLHPGWELHPSYWLPEDADPDAWLAKMTKLFKDAAGEMPMFVNLEA